MQLRALTIAAAIAAAAPLASADIILGNYPFTNDTGTTASVTNLRQKAIAFAMPAGSAYDITSITLRLTNFDANDTAILEIRDHNGTTTSPGAGVVGTFTAPAGGGAAAADYSFSPNGTVTLQPGTSYWIVLSGAASPSTFDWRGSSPGITPTGVATYGPGNLFTSNGGTSWSNSSTINTFRIEGVIPSPASIGLLALAGLAAARRRR